MKSDGLVNALYGEMEEAFRIDTVRGLPRRCRSWWRSRSQTSSDFRGRRTFIPMPG